METKCIAITKKGKKCDNTCYSHLCGRHNKMYYVVTLGIFNPVGLNLLELLTFNRYLKARYEVNTIYPRHTMGEIVNYLKEDPSIFSIFSKMNRYEQLILKEKTKSSDRNEYLYKFET